jgi:hypothetical protein
MRCLLYLGRVVLLAVLVVLLIPSGVILAHERRTIASKYDVVVGWDKEPAFVNQPNAAGIMIYKAGTQDPVEGIEKTLKVQVASGGNAPRELALRTVFGRKGYYVADMIPTRAGSYIFTFVGTIEDTPVNERFESGPGRFDDVNATDDLQIPPAGTSTELQSVRNEINSARTIALVGVILGALGLVVGGLSLFTRRAR